jgi:hypothetical protein
MSYRGVSSSQAYEMAIDDDTEKEFNVLYDEAYAELVRLEERNDLNDAELVLLRNITKWFDELHELYGK